jgi:hypothetical protein
MSRLWDTDVRSPEASEPLAALDEHEADGGAMVGAPGACAHRVLLGLGCRALPQSLTSLFQRTYVMMNTIFCLFAEAV